MLHVPGRDLVDPPGGVESINAELGGEPIDSGLGRGDVEHDASSEHGWVVVAEQ